MNIAMLAPIAWRTPPRHYGPWESVVSLLTEGLVARGCDVTLFATGDSETRGGQRFGYRLYHNVGTQLDWAHQGWCGHCIVDNNGNLIRVGQINYLFEVEKSQTWIGGQFAVDKACIFVIAPLSRLEAPDTSLAAK